jgi:hypothetical protein
MPKEPPARPVPAPADRRQAGNAAERLPQELPSAEAARYIADFTAELASLAKRSRLDLLAYLLDMAHLEASRGPAEPEAQGR